MNKSLANKIRLISSDGEMAFVSSLKEELNSRLNSRVSDIRMNICENLYKTQITTIEESAQAPKILEEKQVIQEKPVAAIIASLQESIKDEKTIVHSFSNGETVTITHEDSRCLVNLHDSLNSMNQQKMRKLMSENYSEYNKILQFSKKHTERTQK
jgi:hypothetical protein